MLEDDYDVLVAETGEEGVRAAERERPDLVLMDLALPGVNGWEATRMIKAHEGLKHIPVIAVTSHAMMGEEEKARGAGCDDYLAKPIDEALLRRKLARFLSP